MLSVKLAPVVSGMILSGLMSFLVAGIATLRAAGLAPDFVRLWLGAWLAAWAIAFPAVLIVAPLTQRLVRRLLPPQ
jgi:hypothetical protein